MKGVNDSACAVSVLLSLLILSGCTIKATTDTATDGTTEFLSSTSGQPWWTQDGLIREGQHAHAFVANNYDHLFTEIARGEGEYLQGFAAVLGVTDAEQDRFCQVLQAHYLHIQAAALRRTDPDVDNILRHIQSLRTNWVSGLGVNEGSRKSKKFSLEPGFNSVASQG